MNDYSEVTCHTQRDVINLIQALNDKKWDDAFKMACALSKDMCQLQVWIAMEANKK